MAEDGFPLLSNSGNTRQTCLVTCHEQLRKCFKYNVVKRDYVNRSQLLTVDSDVLAGGTLGPWPPLVKIL